MTKAQTIANYLDTLKLSDRAKNFIASTDLNTLPELFNGTETAEEVETLADDFQN